MDTRVLVVDDMKSIREAICAQLEEDGISTKQAGDGLAALDMYRGWRPHLIILDIMMPRLDGIQVCKRIRADDEYTGIIFMTDQKISKMDAVKGFHLGAHDYLRKPIEPVELSLKVQALARMLVRVPPPDGKKERLVLERGRLALNNETMRVTFDGKFVPFTATQFGYIRAFLSAPAGAVVTHGMLKESAYGSADLNVSPSTIYQHIRQIRNQFNQVCGLGEKAIIQTVNGMKGYRLSDCKAG